MIQAQDLRIGSWVQHTTQWSYRNESVKPFYFQWEERDWYAVGESTMDLKKAVCPIPLSPEVLVACGFRLETKVWWIFPDEDMDGWVLLDNSPREETFSLCYEQIVLGVPVFKHLHQLQNLHYSLTGEELTYNPSLNKTTE